MTKTHAECQRGYRDRKRGVLPPIKFRLETATQRNYRSKLKRKFGTTPEEINSLMEKQNGYCSICGRKQPDGRRLSIDHLHGFDKIRGVICISCNFILGYAHDDPTILEKCAEYLRQNNMTFDRN